MFYWLEIPPEIPQPNVSDPVTDKVVLTTHHQVLPVYLVTTEPLAPAPVRVALVTQLLCPIGKLCTPLVQLVHQFLDTLLSVNNYQPIN